MPFHDDDKAALEQVLGQTHHLLGEQDDRHAQRLVQDATLQVCRDGGVYQPMPNDNWTADSYEAVLS